MTKAQIAQWAATIASEILGEYVDSEINRDTANAIFSLKGETLTVTFWQLKQDPSKVKELGHLIASVLSGKEQPTIEKIYQDQKSKAMVKKIEVATKAINDVYTELLDGDIASELLKAKQILEKAINSIKGE